MKLRWRGDTPAVTASSSWLSGACGHRNASERWCVNTEDYNESGRVYLELADATPAEVDRGMALLKTLVGVSAGRRAG
jgi:hypothetical protein